MLWIGLKKLYKIIMNTAKHIYPILFFVVTLGSIAYNAFTHNWQLFLLWIIVTLQNLTLGEVLLRIKNK